MNKENKSDYKSILQNINHKPLIVEYIFPFIKEEPYKFLHLIEKDQQLKVSINSQFSSVKKDNSFSKEMNDNIQIIILLKKFQEKLRQYKDKDKNKFLFLGTSYEAEGIINKSDPSFLIYQSNYILNQIRVDESLPKPSIKSLSDIIVNEMLKYEQIQLCLLPSKNNKYIDGDYINKNLNNEKEINNNICSNKEIGILYCIVDDNKYYLDKIPFINENIKINKVYFIYKKGIINIDIKNAIEKYINIINIKNIKQIELGFGFFQIDKKLENKKEFYKFFDRIPIMEIINDALINNNKFSFPISIHLNLSMLKYSSFMNDLKLYLGIYLLFKGLKIDELIVIDSKSYHPNIIKDLENSKVKTLIFKFNGLSSLEDKNFNHLVKKCLRLNIPNIIFYITKKADKDIIKNNDEEIKYNLEPNKNYLFYSEIPTRKLLFNKELAHFEVIDHNNNIILQEIKMNNIFIQNKRDIHNYLISHLFLLKKYNSLCFKWNEGENFYYKIYFIKEKNNYDLYIRYNTRYHQNDGNLKVYEDIEVYVDFNEVINYCKEFLNLTINKIIYDYPFEWDNIPKNENKNKNKKQSTSKKLFTGKMNQKQIMEYELEDDEDYYENEDEEEENEDFN